MKIIRILTFLSCLYSISAHAEAEGPIKWGCEKPGLSFYDEADECDLYIMDNGRRHFIATFSGRSITHTYIKYHTKDLAEIISSNGPDFSPSFFYEISTKRSSKGFDQVSAIDPIHNLIIEVSLDGALLKSIFEEKNSVNVVLVPYEAISSHSAVPRDNIQAEFKDNKIYVYYDDQDEKPQTKVFDLKNYISLDKPGVEA